MTERNRQSKMVRPDHLPLGLFIRRSSCGRRARSCWLVTLILCSLVVSQSLAQKALQLERLYPASRLDERIDYLIDSLKNEITRINLERANSIASGGSQEQKDNLGNKVKQLEDGLKELEQLRDKPTDGVSEDANKNA